MQTIPQIITSLSKIKDAHAAMHFAAEQMAAIEPIDISHKLTADASKRKYGAVAAAIEALQGAQ